MHGIIIGCGGLDFGLMF